MLHILYCALGVLAWNARAATSTPITYDQRQTGDVNVQIHLKDVQVVALLDSELLDDYTDYDYAYDYADFTIKPIVRPTTAKPSTSSVKPWNTWPTNPPTSSTTQTPVVALSSQSSSLNSVEPEKTTKPTISHEALNESSSDSSKANSTIYNLGNAHENNETDSQLRVKGDSIDEPLDAEDMAEDEEKDQAVDSPAQVDVNVKKVCPAGYAMSKKGRCRSTQFRRRVSLVPLTMRLGSKLSEKGRFTVRKDLPIRVYKSEPRQ